MTESAAQRGSDQPDGGGPSREEEGTGRTPHPEGPAEGGGAGTDDPGRTPHSEEPAEGA